MSYLSRYLGELLQTKYKHSTIDFSFRSPKDAHAKLPKQLISDTFAILGGIGAPPMLKAGFWDICMDQNTIIVLDDASHFNRYRKKTLVNEFYTQDIPFPFEIKKYLNFCQRYEKECLKSASANEKWTNKQAETFFGPSDSFGDLYKKGAAQWKWLAYQDFLFDMTTYYNGLKLYRFAYFEEFLFNGKLHKIYDVLLSKDEDLLNGLMGYIGRKAALKPI